MVAGLLAVSALANPDVADWPRWRGPNGDGRWNPPGLPQDFATRQPVQMWRAAIGTGFGGVTVFDGLVYATDYRKQPAEGEQVLCFDAATGRQVWTDGWPVVYGKMEYGNGPRASVVIDGSQSPARAYVLGATGVISCFEARTGNLVWRRDAQRELNAKVPTWGFAASPLIVGDHVIVHIAAQPGGCIVALDKKSGKEAWRAGDDPAGYCTPELIEHNGTRQLIVWGPEHIQSFNPHTGAAYWTFPYKITYGVSIAQPLHVNGVLVVSGYWHGTKAIQLGDRPTQASLLWEQEKDICGLMSAPLHKNGLAYILDKNQGLTCFEVKSGTVRWSDDNQLTPANRNPQFSMVWLDEGRDLIALLNANGELVYARLTPQGAEELGRHQIIGKTWAHPAFAGSRVFARSDSELIAWRLW